MQSRSQTTPHTTHKPFKPTLVYPVAFGVLCILILVTITLGNFFFEKRYTGKIYPHVVVGDIPVGKKTPQEVETYWLDQNKRFLSKSFEFTFENTVATVSGVELGIGYDATLSATQAYAVGRNRRFFSDIVEKYILEQVKLTPYFRWNDDVLDQLLSDISQRIDIPVEDALFDYNNGKVTAFRPSKDGRKVNREKAKEQFTHLVSSIDATSSSLVRISLPVDTISPSITTNKSNTLGIKEHIGRGYSEFTGSIPGRIHNVALAASKLHGVLIKPGETLSFNDVVGDISALTGYQQAYIIQNGRTVLGDGGGVCQVSTTLFRAALNAGLPILERHAHAYRVHYYEEGGFKPGIDATVFSPSVDFKIKNDTPGYILIQTKTDTQRLTLTFDLYGTSDGRKAEVFNQLLWGVTPPPPALEQEDPTLPAGTRKQVDFEAWGAKTSFQYRVVRNGETTQDTTFYSTYRPWQAIFLKGTKT